ncbi:phosphatidylserine decarboxylase family protein [Rhodothermus profundi]|uniref:Phosphatidylserine decarboxylase proenzyme n=1 Tax=Rhodothermus profundi TaxID=633813 RepID=A0A1M6PPE4_9BACT|nr:phosphatidylserine decarboxylase family protein [Rhodothermus profundi]SHK09836.1 phosphatidylserine decarboxylase [Rhodothermus profundi]
MLAPEGYPIIGWTALAAVLLAAGAYYWLPGVWRLVVLLLAALLLGFVLFFFRDPDRRPPEGADTLLLAPADGKVVEIATVDYEPVYLKGPARRLSIFLSPLDVHVNRVPAKGVIELVRYIPGDYLVAWHPKASEQNERSEIGLRHPSGARILFKQIAGVLARRIVFHLQEGDTVQAGQRFGIVKFGSRMDVLVPPHVTFEVKVGDRVRAGETILGRLVAPPPEVEAVDWRRLHNN